MLKLYGQPRAVALIGAFVAAPESRAFLLHGPTGTGKTTTAHYLADALQCDRGPMGGFLEIASGEQGAEAVRELSRSFRLRPMSGVWRVVIVNECDRMTSAAETIWLDVLENLPRHVVIVFTTNNLDKLSQRFSNRCETIEFRADAGSVAKFAREEWNRHNPGAAFPAELHMAGRREDWSPSYRLAVQDVRQQTALAALEPAAPAKPAPALVQTAAPIVRETYRKPTAVSAFKPRSAPAHAAPAGIMGWLFG